MRGYIMTMRQLAVGILLLSMPFYAMAGWEVSKPQTAMPTEPFFQAGNQQDTSFQHSAYGGHAFPNQFANLGTPAPVYAVSISGSLKENLERIMGRYHWKVVWKAPYDYNFDGRVAGSSLPNVIEKLLKPFPLQAIMYMSNRTMTVVAKT